MKTAYLTIDDAPTPGLAEKLTVLTDNDVPALVFCEGQRLAESPASARRAVETGFHLGNHTYSHPRASDLSVETFGDEIARTESLLEEVYDSRSVSRPERVFRFPYGDKGGRRRESFQQVLADYGFQSPASTRITYEWYDEVQAEDRDWIWTFHVEDWAIETRSEFRTRIESAADRLAHPSADIVLCHDANNTPDQFRDFIELLLERGVKFEDPLELLDGPPFDESDR